MIRPPFITGENILKKKGGGACGGATENYKNQKLELSFRSFVVSYKKLFDK